MRYLVMILLSALLFISSCKKDNDDCIGDDCPLSDGTFCPNNMINVDNNCTCPADYFVFKDECIEIEENTYSITNMNCNCLTDVLFSVHEELGGYNYVYTISLFSTKGVYSTGPFTSNSNFSGTVDNFSIILYDPSQTVDCIDDGINTYPEFRGIVVNDTLNLNIYWRQEGPNFYTPIDTCSGYRIPRQ